MSDLENIKSQIDVLVEQKMRLGKKQWDAHAEVMREHPDLRAALVAAKNAQPKR